MVDSFNMQYKISDNPGGQDVMRVEFPLAEATEPSRLLVPAHVAETPPRKLVFSVRGGTVEQPYPLLCVGYSDSTTRFAVNLTNFSKLAEHILIDNEEGAIAYVEGT